MPLKIAVFKNQCEVAESIVTTNSTQFKEAWRVEAAPLWCEHKQLGLPCWLVGEKNVSQANFANSIFPLELVFKIEM